MKGRYKPNEHETSAFETSLSELPIDRPVAVYYRQSTTAQVGNVSTYIQTIDIPGLLQAKGWQADKILLIDADEGVSGQTRIDEREGMKGLFALITGGAIGTVACQDEDRLFRDVTQIQVNIFIEACRRSRVLVLTPTMTYDFAHPTLGQFHARQFRYKCEMAADYITTVVKGKLYSARMRLMHEGRWVGSNVPLGFMVDQRKMVSGIPNPNWRKYVEFEPYSRVVNQWFALLVKNNGNLHRTQLNIKQLGLFPDLSLTTPEGFYLKKPKILLPSISTLAYTFCNVAYLGHWVMRGRVVLYHNHAAIVPVKLFMQAYNYLANLDFEGQMNPHYRPFRESARPQKEAERGVERPLLSGLLYAQNTDVWISVGTGWDARYGQYRYYCQPYQGVRTYRWSKNATSVDQVVCDLVQAKLRVTFSDQTWEQSLQAARQDTVSERQQIEQQLEVLEATIGGYLTSLSVLKTPELIVEVEKRYNEAKRERERLQAQISSWVSEAAKVEGLLALRESFDAALAEWGSLDREQKCQVLHALIEWVETHWDGKQLQLVIHWRDGSQDEATSRKKHGSGLMWLEEEDRLLAQLVRTGADQVTIMEHFPARTWCAIAEHMRQIMPGERRPRYIRVIDRTLSYEEYQRQVSNDSQKCSRSAVLLERSPSRPTSCSSPP